VASSARDNSPQLYNKRENKAVDGDVVRVEHSIKHFGDVAEPFRDKLPELYIFGGDDTLLELDCVEEREFEDRRDAQLDAVDDGQAPQPPKRDRRG
jgi:hypothetical protein